MITSLTVLSAADIECNDTQSTITTVKKTSSDDVIEAPVKVIDKKSEVDTKKSSGSVTNYQELYNKLTDINAEEETVISLDGEGDTYTVTDSITLSNSIKNLVINGNGKKIDGNNKYQFMNIAHASNIVLNNLTVMQCNSSGLYGGALFQKDGNLTINKSVFTLNNVNTSTMYGFGGAIALNNTDLTVINSTFSSNSIVLVPKLSLYNTPERWGGAIYFNGTGNNVKIVDSNFTSNGICQQELNLDGGALYLETDADVNIINSRFTNNSGVDGCAITYEGKNNGNLNVIDSVFELNGYEDYANLGGALCIVTNNTVTINGSNFTSNRAYQGSVVYYEGFTKSNLKVLNSNFTSNGGYHENFYYNPLEGVFELYCDGNVYMYNNTYTSNSGETAGVVYLNGGYNVNLTFEECLFDSNYNESENLMAPALNLWHKGNTTVNACNFTSDEDTSGNMIFIANGNGDSYTIINNTIFDSYVNSNYDLYASVRIYNSGNYFVTNSIFKSNTNEYGILNLENTNGSITLENTTFESNNVSNNAVLKIMSTVNTTINNITFNNNIKTNPDKLKQIYIKNMENVMIYDKKPEKQEIIEDIHITINVFLSDQQINLY